MGQWTSVACERRRDLQQLARDCRPSLYTLTLNSHLTQTNGQQKIARPSFLSTLAVSELHGIAHVLASIPFNPLSSSTLPDRVLFFYSVSRNIQ